MRIDGRCHCGNITYEADVDPDEVYVCHCADCQSISGSAFRWAVPVAEEDFKLLSGEPKTYIKTAESGAKRAQVFCPDCGTPLYATSVGSGPKVFGLRLGAIKQRNAFKPQTQYWTESAMSWIDQVPSLPGSEKQ